MPYSQRCNDMKLTSNHLDIGAQTKPPCMHCIRNRSLNPNPQIGLHAGTSPFDPHRTPQMQHNLGMHIQAFASVCQANSIASPLPIIIITNQVHWSLPTFMETNVHSTLSNPVV
jgi:hypothetical protein